MNTSTKIKTTLGDTSTTPYIELYSNSTGNASIQSSTSYALILQPAGGNVGIGSTSPGYTLTTAGRGYFFATNQDAGWGMLTLDYGNGTNSDIYAIQFKEGGAVNAALGFGSYTSSNLGDLKFYVNNGSSLTTAMTISGSGNVGIGTSSPSYKFHVKSGASNSYFSYFEPSAGSGFLAVYQDTNNHLSLYGANASGTTNVVINTNGVSYLKGGNVIIGGSADNSNTLQVQGTGYFSGNVGIGSTSPAYALDVNGTARVTSLIETSTRTLKNNIESYSTDINKFKQLEPVSFTWKDTGKSDVGLIAEEVEQLFPEFVSKTDEGDVTGINYGKLATIFINVLKQQQEKIEELEDKIKKLTS